MLHREATPFEHIQRGRLAVRLLTSAGAERRERLWEPLADLVGDATFADLALPLAVVAIDLVAGEPVVTREGPLLDALYASCAIPGVFPPAEHAGQRIADAGGSFRVPVPTCRGLGATCVLAIDLPEPRGERLQTGLDLAIRANNVALDQLNRLICAGADVVVRPDVGAIHWADFRQGALCRAMGHDAMRRALPALGRALAPPPARPPWRRWRG